MKKTILILFAIILGLNIHAQRRRHMNDIPQTNREPSEKEIETRERKMNERKQEFIDNFITTLEADEFQKHIVKQHINSFFDERMIILKTRFDHSLDRKNAIENLENTHFKDIEELISEGDMSKIKEMIKGDFDEKEVVKKKKKKRRNKRNKNE
ncbi:hypothetical protein [Winogradskyella bathintestinalis]|uniref:Periplasmic heavy metal sensor n=1 Tax=Winogradskyella bathintestinalis TaxID=3035208 RepID=A0ABT7ZVS2_9FLAO|nr:hypothetical protein [Winogradskyella bathintestinalis]MDN3493046.1 hypothetical protein [Winogradskyella bathintestinalis]